jgi:hypothetical protein
MLSRREFLKRASCAVLVTPLLPQLVHAAPAAVVEVEALPNLAWSAWGTWSYDTAALSELLREEVERHVLPQMQRENYMWKAFFKDENLPINTRCARIPLDRSVKCGTLLA